MTFFLSDYSLGAHPRVLKALTDTNLVNTDGYGHDPYSDECENLIRELIGKPNAQVYFFSGGSIANVVTLTSMLKPYEGVIAPRTAHIYIHETGAIEMHGNRIFATDTFDGKLLPEEIEKTMLLHEDEHTVVPKVCSISHPTENGGVYTKDELLAIRKVCDKYGLYLYLDGARLGTALAWPNTDVTIQDLANICDAFYIGGTKLGALYGEAVILVNPELGDHFRYHMKRAGAHIAKGRMVPVQFLELLKGGENSLYYEIARYENELALKLAKGISDKGYKFWVKHETNQIFIIIDNDKMHELEKTVMFCYWKKYNETQSVIRFVTNWNTSEEDINTLLNAL